MDDFWRKLLLVILGTWIVFTVIIGLFTGEIIGLGTIAGVGNTIHFKSNPIEFSICIILYSIGGIWSIKAGLSAKKLN